MVHLDHIKMIIDFNLIGKFDLSNFVFKNLN